MRLERLLDALARRRVGAWSVYATSSRRLSLGVKDRQAGNAHAPLTLSQSASARYLLVWDDGRVSRGLLERRQIEEDVERALDDAHTTAYDDPDAARVLGPDAFPEVELYDPVVAGIAGGDTTWIAERLAAVRRWFAARGLRTWSGSFGAAEGQGRLVTSAGLDVTVEGTSIGWHVTVNGEVGDGFSARTPDTEEAFEARLERLGRLAAELERDAAPARGSVQPVILHPRVVEAYVVDTLLANLDGATVAHDDGHFRREQFGATAAPVVREEIRLGVDPLRPLCAGSYRFTSEGLPAARCDFIDRGRLATPVLDLKYAQRLAMRPTPIPSAADTLVFEGPPALPLDRALDLADGGVLVLSVLGVHTQDRASGDFSLSAPQALRLRGGGFAGRLRATLSGNLFDLLGSAQLGFVAFDDEPVPGLRVDCRLDPK